MKKMKAVAALVFAFMMASVAVVTSTGLAFDESSVGVKEDDWIEYDVSVAYW